MPSSVLFAVASLIWGSTFWAITLQLGDAPPAVSVAYRFALASATLFAWCRARGDKLLLPLRTQRWLLLQGFLSFGISYICVYSAEQYLVSAMVAVMFALMVFWSPICNRIALGTPIPGKAWATGAAAILGVAMLFSRAVGTALREMAYGGSGTLLVGTILAVAGSIASAAGGIVVTKVREQSSNLVLTMAWSMLWGTLFVAAWALVSGQHFVLPRQPRYWAALGYLSVFGSIIAFSCYFTLINRVGAQKAAFVGVAEPVLSVLMSVAVEHYRPAPVEWLGMALCLASVAWALRAPAQPTVALRTEVPA